MIKKKETFADRFLKLKGDESFQSLSDRMKKKGVDLSPQGMHKWTQGGGITPENIEAVAEFFDLSPAELLFGPEAVQVRGGYTEDVDLLARALMKVPERFRKELARDIFLLAKAYTDSDKDRNLHGEIVRALKEL